jgi:hypothetical protein
MNGREHDFIPRPDAAFETFFRNVTDFVLDNNARWINNTSESGPWSDIESAFIP